MIVAEIDIAAIGWVSVAEMVEADRVAVDENTVRGPGRARRCVNRSPRAACFARWAEHPGNGPSPAQPR
jgi:hypothetical protein